MPDVLTAELIARAHPAPYPADVSTVPLMSQDALDASRQAMLGPLDPAADIWLFGYGSLMWKPELDFAERRVGRVYGWHRRFCLWQRRFRGSPAAPGWCWRSTAAAPDRGADARRRPRRRRQADRHVAAGK